MDALWILVQSIINFVIIFAILFYVMKKYLDFNILSVFNIMKRFTQKAKQGELKETDDRGLETGIYMAATTCHSLLIQLPEKDRNSYKKDINVLKHLINVFFHKSRKPKSDKTGKDLVFGGSLDSKKSLALELNTISTGNESVPLLDESSETLPMTSSTKTIRSA